jgi:hypothetical protein
MYIQTSLQKEHKNKIEQNFWNISQQEKAFLFYFLRLKGKVQKT